MVILTSKALHWPRVVHNALSHTLFCEDKREEWPSKHENPKYQPLLAMLQYRKKKEKITWSK